MKFTRRIPLGHALHQDYRHTFEIRAGRLRVQIVTEPPKHVRLHQSKGLNGSAPKLKSQILDWMEETMFQIQNEGEVPF